MTTNPISEKIPLVDVSCSMLVNLADKNGLAACRFQILEKSLTGAVLQHCDTPEDIKEILGISLPIARALFSFVDVWKKEGVSRSEALEESIESVIVKTFLNEIVPVKAMNIVRDNSDTVDDSNYPDTYEVAGLEFASRHWNGRYVKSTKFRNRYPSYFIDEHRVIAIDWVFCFCYGCCCCPLKASQGLLFYNGQQWQLNPGHLDSLCGSNTPCVDLVPCGFEPQPIYGPNANFPDGYWGNGVSIIKLK